MAICSQSLQSLAQSEMLARVDTGIHARVDTGIHGVPSSVAVIAPTAGMRHTKTNEARLGLVGEPPPHPDASTSTAKSDGHARVRRHTTPPPVIPLSTNPASPDAQTAVGHGQATSARSLHARGVIRIGVAKIYAIVLLRFALQVLMCG
jgi:hypothetical protein